MPVSFFRPGYLWALAALAIPILVHLLNRPRTRRMDFSTLQFWQQTAVQADRARSLRRLLQLLCRLAIVALLTLIFARPRMAGEPLGVLASPQLTACTWVDPTVSMAYREAGRTLGEAAAALVDTIEARLPATARRLRFEEAAAAFTPAQAGRAQQPSVRHGPAGLRSMAEALVAVAAGPSAGPSVLFVLSDMQEPTAAALDTLLADRGVPGPVVCVSLAPQQPWNYGVAGAGVAPENAGVVEARVYAGGRDFTQGGVRVSLEGLRAGGATLTVRSGDTVSCAISVPSSGGASGAVTIEAADPFPLDDSVAFARQPQSRRSALVVGDPAASYPIVAALASAGSGFWSGVSVRSEREVSVEDVDGAALIVLSGLEQPVQAVRSLLASRALGRKAVLFSPSLAPEASMLNRQVLEHLGWRKPLLVDSAGRGAAPLLPDTLSALWRGFTGLRQRDAAVYSSLSGLPGQPLLRLESGATLVSRCDDSSGHVWILAATPLGVSRANNLCETGFFVPFIDRLARHGLGAAGSAADAWVAGVARRNPFFGGRGGAQVFTAANAPVGRWESQPQVVLQQPGVYRVQPDGEAGYWISAVIDPMETRLVYREPRVAPERRRFVTVVKAADLVGLLERSGRRTIETWLWVALVIAVLGEMVLGRSRSEERGVRSEEGRTA